MKVVDVKQSIHVAKLMIKSYEERGGGHSQKEALDTLIGIAERADVYKMSKIVARAHIESKNRKSWDWIPDVAQALRTYLVGEEEVDDGRK